MSHPPFSSGQLPGTSNGTGTALLPTITAELRGEFYPLLATLASCPNDLSSTYIMELFFTLVRFDAVLKEKERQLLVTTAQQLITKQLHQLRKVTHTQKLLSENERFVGELVERCAALECLCRARDGDDECRTNDGEDTDDTNASGQALPTLNLESELADAQGCSERTTLSVANTRTAVTTGGHRRVGLAATYAGHTNTTGGGGQELQRVSFHDSFDGSSSRLMALPTEGGGAVTPPSPGSGSTPLVNTPHQQNSAPRKLRQWRHAERANSETLDEDPVRAATTSSILARTTGSTHVNPAVYSGLQQALQGHFRNKVRSSLTGGASTVQSNLSDLVYTQQQSAQLRGTTTRPSSRSSEQTATADDTAAEAGSNSPQQHEAMALNLSLTTSAGSRRYPLSSSHTVYQRNTNPSNFSVATVASAASTNNAPGMDAGRSVGPRMSSFPSALYHGTMQEPVVSAKVWDRMFWRFLAGQTSTGDLAVLLTLLNHGNPGQTQGAAGCSDVAGGHKDSFRIGWGCSSLQSGTANTAAAVGDAAGVSRTRLAATPHSPEYGVQLLIDGLKRKGSYAHLALPQNSADVSSTKTTGRDTFSVADETISGSVTVKADREAMCDDIEQQQQQHAQGMLRSPERQYHASFVGMSPPAARVNHSSSTVLLNLDDWSREEEVRLHRDFWAHIPTILVTLTEGVMYSDSSSCGGPASSQSATNEDGSRSEERLDREAGAGVAAAADCNRDNELAALHPPSAEALQLMPTFSPLLRNYNDAVRQLIRSATEYARSTQNQHARALSVVATAATQQQQQQQVLPPANPEESEHNATVPNNAASAPPGNARTGVARTPAQNASVVCPPDSSSVSVAAAAAAGPTGSALSANNSAPVDIVERSLLAAGSHTEVRAVDIVVYAILTAIYIQCTAAVDRQQQARVGSTGFTTAAPISTNTGAVGTSGEKTSLSEGSRTPASAHSPEGCGPWPGILGSPSFGADGGAGMMSGNNTYLSADEERVLDKSAPSADVSGRLRDSGSGSGYAPNVTFSPPPKTLFHQHLYPLHPMVRRAGGKAVGSAIRFTRSSSFYDPRNVYLSPLHGPHQLQQQTVQLPRSFSLEIHSPTDAALSLLWMAHNKKNCPDDWAGRGSAASTCSDGPAIANTGNQLPPGFNVPCSNLRFIEPSMQDILTCANEFSWVSLPSIMKAELQHLQETLSDTSRAVQRMERQVRGELALLLFRVLSIVLNWLMPAVYVADVRLWLFYRKWCCDLYRVLCSHDALLEEFHTLLDQRNLTGSSTTTLTGDLHEQPGVTKRGMHVVSPAEAESVRTRGPFTPQQGPSKFSSKTPGVRAVTTDSGEHCNSRRDYAAREEATVSTASTAQPTSSQPRCSQEGGSAAAINGSMEDAFSFILPGTSLSVSVSHETPPVQPAVLNLLAQEEANLRGEALADMASLRAAQALLSNEGTVVPLPRPFLITRLVAATLRGMGADMAESLLRVVGQPPASANFPGGSPGGGDLGKIAADSMEDAQRDRSARCNMSQNQYTVALDDRKSREQETHCATGDGGRADDGKGDERESVLKGRHRRHAAHCTVSGCPRRSTSAGARVGGSGSSSTTSHYRVDSDDDGGYGDHWYSVLERSERSQIAPLSLQNPAMEKNSRRRASQPAASIPTVFPRKTTHTPLNEHASTSSSQHPFRPHQPVEGPTLVHHHRFRYPVVRGYADVAKLYLSTLEDAELHLSPHDPVYASLVLSAADLHLHNLRDRDTAVALVNAYLADVREEHIQGPVWEELPTVAIGDGSGEGAPPSLNPAADVAGDSSSTSPAPTKGFSVTRARQGNTQGPTSTTPAPSVTGVGAGSPVTAPLQAAAALPQQQRPYVPMVIASWNNEEEKEEFLATLQLLRQMQAYLAEAPMKSHNGGALRNKEKTV